MSNDFLSLLLDLVILVLLGATIFYVAKLTKGLSDFKAHRKDFDDVILRLLSSIDQAERSIQSLKQTGAAEAAELESMIAKSKMLSEELKIINESGESMAKRLEKLAETNRKIVQPGYDRFYAGASRRRKEKERGEDDAKISSPVPDEPEKEQAGPYDKTLKRVEKNEDGDFPSFMIRDRELEDLNDLGSRLDKAVSNDEAHRMAEEDDIMPENLQSKAERELLEALRSNKSKSKGGR